MKKIYKDILFEKRIIVAEDETEQEDFLKVLFSLAALFNVKIISGEKLVRQEMISYISEQLGEHVPEPFYRGFPRSVRELSSDQLLFDQFFHYINTYGFNYFEEAGHSVFETLLERTAFKERAEVMKLSVMPESEAEEVIAETVEGLLLSSRPINDRQYAFVLEYIKDHNCEVRNCASKNTAVRLLADSRDMRFARFLSMSDVIKLVDEINYSVYGSEDIKKLNLRNQDRKFITAVINMLFESDKCDIETCCEKKAVWCGLLHHIHYKPHDKLSAFFTYLMRGNENLSVYSLFEEAMAENDISKAVAVLKEGKGSTAVLRNLNYIVSRCSSRDEVGSVIDSIDSSNIIVLIQLLLQYNDYSFGQDKRVFKFTRHNKLKVHNETDDESGRRRSVIPEKYAKAVSDKLLEMIRKTLRGRLGKVYIDPDMKRVALPLQENTSQGGLGVLAKGTRIPIDNGKKIRAFTYWEKVNDIDLSVFGINDDGTQNEFSWRTMYDNQSDFITYSGDETSGYHGGSEYFDIDAEQFRKHYPHTRYMIFCDNVFSGLNFNQCLCKAGYMLRDVNDSGEVFEPKTVKSSFRINCESTFAYLFGIDLETNDFVWLNTAREGNTRVAGTTPLSFLTAYFHVTDVINVYTFFEMMASELTNDLAEADVIVTDKDLDIPENTQIIRSYDFDKLLALMNV